MNAKKISAISMAALAGASSLAVPMSAIASTIGEYTYRDDCAVTVNKHAQMADADFLNAYQLFVANFKADASEGAAAGSHTNDANHIQWASSMTDEAKKKLVDFCKGEGYVEWLNGQGLSGEDATVQNTAQNVAEFISTKIGESTDVDSHDPKWVDTGTFAKKLSNLVTSGGFPAPTQVATGTTLTGEEGYWLIVGGSGTNSIGTAPIWMPLGGATSEIDIKASPVTVDKEVKKDSKSGDEAWGPVADAEIGELHDYRVKFTLPGNYNSFDQFRAHIEDTMTGLELPVGADGKYDLSGVSVKLDDGTDVTDYFIIAMEDPDASPASTTVKKLTVSCDDLKAKDATAKKLANGTELTLAYQAKLNGNANVGNDGNINGVTYEYSNDPHSYTSYGSKTDEVRLFTYRVTLDKLDKVTKTPLAGAKFTLQNADGKYAFFVDTRDATDPAADNATPMLSWTDDAAKAYQFTTDAQGEIKADDETFGSGGMKGLDANEIYTLKETAAPEHYSIIGDGTIRFKVVPTYDTDAMQITGLTAQLVDASGNTTTAYDNFASITATQPNATEGTVDFTILNDRDVLLAITGGSGVALAGLVAAAAGFGWHLKNRRSVEEDA